MHQWHKHANLLAVSNLQWTSQEFFKLKHVLGKVKQKPPVDILRILAILNTHIASVHAPRLILNTISLSSNDKYVQFVSFLCSSDKKSNCWSEKLCHMFSGLNELLHGLYEYTPFHVQLTAVLLCYSSYWKQEHEKIVLIDYSIEIISSNFVSSAFFPCCFLDYS